VLAALRAQLHAAGKGKGDAARRRQEAVARAEAAELALLEAAQSQQGSEVAASCAHEVAEARRLRHEAATAYDERTKLEAARTQLLHEALREVRAPPGMI